MSADANTSNVWLLFLLTVSCHNNITVNGHPNSLDTHNIGENNFHSGPTVHNHWQVC